MKKRNKRRIFKRTIVILLILGALFLHFYVPRFITEIKNPIIELFRAEYLITTSPSFPKDELNGKIVNFKSFDNIELSSYLTYSNLDTAKGTIILLHGIRSNKEHFVALSSQLSRLGYNSVAVDSRAHGQSDGIHCTFGVKEKKDVSELITVLSKEENITENIGIWGQSLGAAIGLQAIGEDTRIKFGIIESTFSDFRAVTNDYLRHYAGFTFEPLTNYFVHRAGEIAEFDPEEARPIQYCEKIEQPILIVHGNKDERIAIQYAKANYAKIPSLEKEFIEVKNAGHSNVWDVGGSEYFERVVKFIEKHTVNSQSKNHR